MGVPFLFTFMITIEENLNLELENVCMLVMLPIKRDTNVLTQFLKKMFVTMDVTFFELTPVFTIDFQERRKKKKIQIN